MLFLIAIPQQYHLIKTKSHSNASWCVDIKLSSVLFSCISAIIQNKHYSFFFISIIGIWKSKFQTMHLSLINNRGYFSVKSLNDHQTFGERNFWRSEMKESFVETLFVTVSDNKQFFWRPGQMICLTMVHFFSCCCRGAAFRRCCCEAGPP